MIDVTKKGTVIPFIPKGTPYYLAISMLRDKFYFTDDHYNMVSSGVKNIYGEDYVLLDYPQSTTMSIRHCYQVPLSEINKLNMIDYKIVGTKLPVIPKDTKFSTTNTYSSTNKIEYSSRIPNTESEFVSYGSIDLNGETHILAEIANYTTNKNFYLFRLSDLLALSDKQDIVTETRKPTGYKCPCDIPTWKLFKGDILSEKINTGSGTTGYVTRTDATNGYKVSIPSELVETWEAVYKPIETIITIGTSKIEVKISKDGIFVEGVRLEPINIGNLVYTTPNSVNRLRDGNTSYQPYSVKLMAATYKIGCSEFTLEELKQVIETYENIRNGKTS